MAPSSLDLVGFVSSMGGDKALRVEESLGEGFVRLRISEAERRQAAHDVRCIEDALIELLRNSRDAGARHIYVATAREGDLRTLVVLDDGTGIPEDMHERVLEARVTSKLDSVHMDRWGIHGRGMALFSICENALSAGIVSSAPGKGTAIRVVSDATTLPERADQSSWPQIGVNEDGEESCVRGPHNLIRTCCEFALEERGTCEVYFGSPAEIIATARARASLSVKGSDLLLLDSLESLPVLARLRAAADARELREQAVSVGLEMSERTAHRIVSGEIPAQESVLSRLAHGRGRAESPSHEVDLMRDRRGLKVAPSDLEEFSRLMERDFALLAERYYLTLSGEPRVRASGRRVTVTFELAPSD